MRVIQDSAIAANDWIVVHLYGTLLDKELRHAEFHHSCGLYKEWRISSSEEGSQEDETRGGCRRG